MLSEARVLPVAAADELILDRLPIGKERFPRSADNFLALTALRCGGVVRLVSVPSCQNVVFGFASMRRVADQWLRLFVAVQAHGASHTFCWSSEEQKL